MKSGEISTISLFCEDIREEVGGQFTLVGILPDNIEVSSVPGSIPKLGIFTRINIPTGRIPPQLAVKILAQDGSVLVVNSIDPVLISKTISEAIDKGAPFTGIVSRVMGGNIPVISTGRISAIVEIDGNQIESGFLNFVQPAHQ